MKKPVALIILDGWGHRDCKDYNAIAKARTPFFDSLWNNYPHSLLEASGEFVGLPDGQMGNSEIGHTTIGAGKIIDTDLVRINKDIKSGDFAKNKVLNDLIEHADQHYGRIHVIGLIGNGGVHSHQDHLVAFIRLCASTGNHNLSLHLITDGRDAAPNEAIKSITQIDELLKETNAGIISTVSGRYFSMDRDNNWDRLEKFTDIFFRTQNENNEAIIDWKSEIQRQYDLGKTDEHIEPFELNNESINGSSKLNSLNQNDSVFFFNYRSDRARMLSSKILDLVKERNLYFATMTEYNSDFDANIVYPPIKIETTLAKEISAAGLTQVHIAETEKFPHATYFLNGGEQNPYGNERHIMVESNKHVKTHDEAPEMKAKEIADHAILEIKKGTEFIFINFANADMVGHSAKEEAIIRAVEFTDEQLKRVVEALDEVEGTAFVTADHGNAEINFDESKNECHTSHTTNPVPAILTLKGVSLYDGSLKDIAPTILQLLEIKVPGSMTGEVLYK